LFLLKNKGNFNLTFDQLNRFMSNMGDEPFTYDMLQQAYNSDPKIQNIISDFDQKTIKIKSGIETDLDTNPAQGGTSVSTMAKRATNLEK
jgi:hypothetical protein